MYYLKFVSENGTETCISCYSYCVQQRDGWKFVTAYNKEEGGVFDTNFCVGKDVDYCSMFVMNINGKTIDKIVPMGS